VEAAQGIITAVCADADDRDAVLDALLRPRNGWPLFSSADEEAASSKALAASTSGRPGTLSELAYALGTELGFNAIAYDSAGRNRCSRSHML
jgi:hypothetical protein